MSERYVKAVNLLSVRAKGCCDVCVSRHGCVTCGKMAFPGEEPGCTLNTVLGEKE